MICKCGCGRTFEPTNPCRIYFSTRCGQSVYNEKMRLAKTKESNTQVAIFKKTHAIRLLQVRLKKEFHALILEIEQTLYPKEEPPDERTWIEKKYPCNYPSLSNDFQRWERGRI